MASNRESVTFGHLLECHPGYFRNLDYEREDHEDWHTNEEEAVRLDVCEEGLVLDHWYDSRTARMAAVERDYFGTFRVYRFEVNGTTYEQLEMVSPGEWGFPEPEYLPDALHPEIERLYAEWDQKYDLSDPEVRAALEKEIEEDNRAYRQTYWPEDKEEG